MITEEAVLSCREFEGGLPLYEFFKKLRSILTGPYPGFFREELRTLKEDEIRELEASGNRCADWSGIQVSSGFTTQNICNSLFLGKCFLGNFTGIPENPVFDELPPGIRNSTVSNSAVGDNCLVHNVSLLSGFHVEKESVLIDCGRICCSDLLDSWITGNICPGNETGGREFPLLPGIPLSTAVDAGMGERKEQTAENLFRFRKDYSEFLEGNAALIGAGSRISGSRLVENCLIGPGAVIDCASEVSGSLIVGGGDAPAVIRGGAVVRRSILRPGAVVDTFSVVLDSYLAESVHVEKHAKISGSFCAKGCGIGEGEVTASLLGPYTAMHHQSLLIAALWPEGRGNIGYGANVGSNHTGRAPDQECRIGEGCFFGLGCCIKYPSDFSRAPHTIIATGVVLPPVKLEFPYSLIVEEQGTLLLKPGWVWGASAFTLLRNRDKYARRGDGVRPLFSEAAIQATEKALLKIRDSDPDIPAGLVLRDRDRLQGIESYMAILRYAVFEYTVQYPDSEFTARLLSSGLYELASGKSRELLRDSGYVKEQFDLERTALLKRSLRSLERDRERGESVLGSLYSESHREEGPLISALRRELDSTD